MEENKVRIILGIDVSTTCLGVSLAKYDGKDVEILKISHVKPKVSKKLRVLRHYFLKRNNLRNSLLNNTKILG